MISFTKHSVIVVAGFLIIIYGFLTNIVSPTDKLLQTYTPPIATNNNAESSYKEKNLESLISETLDEDIYTALDDTFLSLSPRIKFSFSQKLTKEDTEKFSDKLSFIIKDFGRLEPDFFWLSNGEYFLTWYHINGVYSSVTVEFSYCETKETIAIKQANINSIVADTISKAPLDNFEKVKYFHDVIIQNTKYDFNAAEYYSTGRGFESAFNITGVFLDKKAVCEGYSKAFQLLCDASSIPCITVFGTALGTDHAWNYVQLNEKWYLVDTTWDDQENTIYACFLKGSKSKIGTKNISSIYIPLNATEYPSLSEKEYFKTDILPEFNGNFVPKK